jgi:hypothetical protein
MTAVVSSGNRKFNFSRPFHSLARTAYRRLFPLKSTVTSWQRAEIWAFEVTGVYRTHPQGAPSFSQPDFRTTVGSVAGKGS